MERIPREKDPKAVARMVSQEGVAIESNDDVYRIALHLGATHGWFGVRMLKSDFDCRRYLEILNKIRPEIVVETGVSSGGSALFFMHVLSMLEIDCLYLGIDLEGGGIDGQVFRLADERRWLYAFVYRDCLHEKTLEVVRKHACGKRQLFVLDSVHTEEHVTEELRLYAPLVERGSYLVVEDTDHNGHPNFPNYGPSAWEAVESFMSANGMGTKLGFVRDVEIEKMFPITNSPGGWLKRC